MNPLSSIGMPASTAPAKRLPNIKQAAKERIVQNMFQKVKSSIQNEGADPKSTSSSIRGAAASVTKPLTSKLFTAKEVHMVLVVDQIALRVLASIFNVNTLHEYGVTIVEQLELSREPLPGVHAVYLLDPNYESVSKLCAESHSQYKKFHIFFLSTLPEHLMIRLKQCDPKFVRKIENLVELDLRFLVTEPNVVEIGSPYAGVPFIYSDDSVRREDFLRDNTDKLFAACSLMAKSSAWTVKFSAQSPFARIMAKRFLELQTQAKNTNMSVSGRSGSKSGVSAEGSIYCANYPEATLLILDRAYDLITVLLHEFTYQAMAYDVLPLDKTQVTGVHFKLPENATAAEGGGAASGSRLVRFGDEASDQVWCKVRHLHIADGVNIVNDDFKYFLETNAAAKLHLSKSAGATDGSSSSAAASPDIRQLTQAVRALPEYSERIKQHAMHVNAFAECFDRFKKLQLEQVARVEQDLALGRDASDNRVKSLSVIHAMEAAFQSQTILLQDKLRILLIALAVSLGNGAGAGFPSSLYLASFPKEFELNKYVASLQLSQQSIDTIKGFVKVLQSLPPSPESILRPKSSFKMRKMRKMAKRKRETKKHLLSPRSLSTSGKAGSLKLDDNAPSQQPDTPYELSRYSTPLEEILVLQCDSQLSSESYPCIHGTTAGTKSEFGMLSSSGSATDGKAMKMDDLKVSLLPIQSSVKSHIADDFGGDTAQNGSAHDYQRLLFVYIVGGASFSEVRTVYEVEDLRQGMHVILGTESVLTASDYLKSFEAIHNQALVPGMMNPAPRKPVKLETGSGGKSEDGGTSLGGISSSKPASVMAGVVSAGGKAVGTGVSAVSTAASSAASTAGSIRKR